MSQAVRTIHWRNVEQKRLVYYRMASKTIRATFLKEKKSVLNAFLNKRGSIDQAVFYSEWVETLSTIWRVVLAEFGAWVAIGLGGTVDFNEVPSSIKSDEDVQWEFDPWSQAIRRYIATYTAEKVVLITESTKKSIKKIIANGLDKGHSDAQIASKLSELYDGFSIHRSNRIARTEVVGASNFGILEAALQSMLDLLKEWISMRDDRVRDSHVAVDSQLRELGELFSNGLMFPGDPSGSAEETIHCRCTLRLVRRKNAA